MNRSHRSSAARLAAVAFVLSIPLAGCGSGQGASGSSEEIVKSQQGASDAWAKAKAEGKDKRTSKVAVDKRSRRGSVNTPGLQ